MSGLPMPKNDPVDVLRAFTRVLLIDKAVEGKLKLSERGDALVARVIELVDLAVERNAQGFKDDLKKYEVFGILPKKAQKSLTISWAMKLAVEVAKEVN